MIAFRKGREKQEDNQNTHESEKSFMYTARRVKVRVRVTLTESKLNQRKYMHPKDLASVFPTRLRQGSLPNCMLGHPRMRYRSLHRSR